MISIALSMAVSNVRLGTDVGVELGYGSCISYKHKVYIILCDGLQVPLLQLSCTLFVRP